MPGDYYYDKPHLLGSMRTGPDLMNLGGLNEGVWPQNPSDDPWLTRQMRATLKLSQPERRIGLSAHDFACMAAQPDVLLTWARRQEGAQKNSGRSGERPLFSGRLHEGGIIPSAIVLNRGQFVHLLRRALLHGVGLFRHRQIIRTHSCR